MRLQALRIVHCDLIYGVTIRLHQPTPTAANRQPPQPPGHLSRQPGRRPDGRVGQGQPGLCGRPGQGGVCWTHASATRQKIQKTSASTPPDGQPLNRHTQTPPKPHSTPPPGLPPPVPAGRRPGRTGREHGAAGALRGGAGGPGRRGGRGLSSLLGMIEAAGGGRPWEFNLMCIYIISAGFCPTHNPRTQPITQLTPPPSKQVARLKAQFQLSVREAEALRLQLAAAEGTLAAATGRLSFECDLKSTGFAELSAPEPPGNAPQTHLKRSPTPLYTHLSKYLLPKVSWRSCPASGGAGTTSWLCWQTGCRRCRRSRWRRRPRSSTWRAEGRTRGRRRWWSGRGELPFWLFDYGRRFQSASADGENWSLRPIQQSERCNLHNRNHAASWASPPLSTPSPSCTPSASC
jgi:hypothetical protein